MKKATLFLLSSALWLSCEDSSNSARLEVRLTDAPGDYEAVHIDIQSVEVHVDDGTQNEGWTTLDTEAGVYDLLKLTNGQDTLLASEELPSGRVSQIRLILGDNNSVKVDGEELAMTTPSAQQSGLKLNVQADLTEGIVYTILLDFDAARSVVKAGASKKYLLKPVIRAVTEAQSGAIEGLVEPAESLPAVFAINGTDTVATTYADAAGKFLLRGVPAGTYVVSFNPKEGYQPQQKEDVAVTLGVVTDVGVVTILE
jgi:hypothetical protein